MPVDNQEPRTEIVRELDIPGYIDQESTKLGLDAHLTNSIAFCESTHRQFEEGTQIPLRGIKNSFDIGIFQINEQFHLTKSQSLGYDIYTPEGNVGYALWLIQNEGTKHWNASKDCWSQRIANNV